MRQLSVAERTGIDFGPYKQEAFMRENTGGKFGVSDAFQVFEAIDTGINPRNIGRSLVQGATFNFADELLGLVSPAKKEEMRLREDLYSEEHPVANIVGQMAGGFAVPGSGAARVAKGAVGVGQAALRGAAFGAGAGTLAGAGAGETTEERVSGATTGAGAGAVLGGGLTGLLGTTRLATSPKARASRRLDETITESGGIDRLRERLTEFNRAGKRDEVIFGDLTPETQELLRFVANNDEKAFVRLKTITGRRQSGQSDRLLSDVKRLVGNPHAESELRRMKGDLDAWARSPEGFEGLRQQNPQLQDIRVLGALKEYLAQPRVKELWARAREERFVGGDPDLGAPSFQQVHNLKMKLDRAISKGFATPGERDLARGLAEVRDNVDDALGLMVPEYRARNVIYRQGIAKQKALTLGHQWATRADNRELINSIIRFSPGELDAFRKGFVSRILDRLRSTKTNRNLANDLMTDRSLQERMQIVFGDQQVFDDLMRAVSAEGRMAGSQGATGGSQTHRLGMGLDYDPAEMLSVATHGVMFGPQAVAGTLASSVGRRLPNVIARRTARALMPSLLTKGTPAIDALLTQMAQRRPQAVGTGLGVQLPIAAGIGGARQY